MDHVYMTGCSLVRAYQQMDNAKSAARPTMQPAGGMPLSQRLREYFGMMEKPREDALASVAPAPAE